MPSRTSWRTTAETCCGAALQGVTEVELALPPRQARRRPADRGRARVPAPGHCRAGRPALGSSGGRRPLLPTTTPNTRSTRTAPRTTAARPSRRSAGLWPWTRRPPRFCRRRRGGSRRKVQGARGASLRTQECDKAARVRWLQYHDRDTENLSGMLPLAVGMRVVLADHLDRAEDKLLLRGSAGRVHSWVWKKNDLRPTCVYVKFDGATWQLDGAPEPGLYPVYPARKVWKLDAKRKKPVLKIARTQLPLAPAYAITAHGSQATMPWAAACGRKRREDEAQAGPRRLVYLPDLRGFLSGGRRCELRRRRLAC